MLLSRNDQFHSRVVCWMDYSDKQRRNTVIGLWNLDKLKSSPLYSSTCFIHLDQLCKQYTSKTEHPVTLSEPPFLHRSSRTKQQQQMEKKEESNQNKKRKKLKIFLGATLNTHAIIVTRVTDVFDWLLWKHSLCSGIPQAWNNAWYTEEMQYMIITAIFHSNNCPMINPELGGC